ncbi:MAG TPA: hypothetical protein VGZ91_16720 [Candidatus Sulfotelmatobacter sp.]|nr:hypothetical protein [Candidatus Sulfotelmatobacter sp.]
MRTRGAGFAALTTLVLAAACGLHAQSPSTGSSGFGARASTHSESVDGSESSLALTALELSEPSVIGGESTTITLTLADPAPAGGAKIMVSSSDAGIVQTPASVEFEDGQTSLTFPVSTLAVTAAESIMVRAQFGGSIAGANLLVLPPTTAPFSVSVSPATVTVQQGKSGSGTVTTKVNTGFDASLQLKASGEPTGVSLTLKPAVIPAPGAGTSKLSISVASSVPTGSYPLTVTASEGSNSASGRTTLKVISGTGNPNATFKGCWYRQSGHRYQGVDISVGNPGSYPFNAVLYHGTTCNANDFADQIGFGELINFGGFGWTFWFTAFADQTNMSALWYVGDDTSQCVSYAAAPDC